MGEVPVPSLEGLKDDAMAVVGHLKSLLNKPIPSQ